MGLPRLTALAVAALLAAGCGDILHELDNANDLASKPSGNGPAQAGPKPPSTGAAPGSPGAAAPEAGRGPDVVARVKGLLGLGDAPKDSRRPPDPNDPMVSCRLGGSISFMLKSGCVNRRGTVIASKGVPH